MQDPPSFDRFTRLPRWLVGATIGICLIPFFLELFGLDFGSPGSLTDLDPSIFELSLTGLSDVLHRTLSGSFTHTILEWSAFCTAIFTVVLALTYFNIKRDITTPILGVALFCAGMMDAFHTLAADRLIDAVADNNNLIPFTWAICRLFNGAIVLVGILVLLVARPERIQRSSTFIVGVSLAFGALAYGIVYFCATSDRLPETMFPAALVTRPWDIAPLLLFVISGFFVFPTFDRLYPSLFSHALIVSTIPNVTTQLHMVFGSTKLFDSDFNIAHFLKIVAYLVPLAGLILDYNYTYRNVDRINRDLNQTLERQQATALELQASEAHLRQLNEELEERVANRTARLASASASAEAASKAKSRFLANMSHELRTPLNGIMGYAQILQNLPEMPQVARPRLKTIHQCGAYLLALIEDILDISKVEAGKMELAIAPFHLPAFLDSVVELSRVRAEAKSIDCSGEFDSELPIGVEGDGKRLQQVLLNLLGNAVKFTDTGSVRLVVSRAEGDRIRFEVRDTGVGIAADEVDKIFKPFEQVGESGKQSEGTGLGLSISQRIVDLMGGSIAVASEVGVGSKFWFEISLPEAANWAESAWQISKEGRIVGIRDREPLVLVVDDKWENRSVLANLLAPIGFEVIEASGGAQALQLAHAQKPDIIISDISMQPMDGLELVQRLRNNANFIELPIVAASASVFEEDRRQCLEAGFSDFLAKPIDAGELMRQLDRYLQLDWIYAEENDSETETSELPSAELVRPASDKLELLYQLAMQGNMKALVREAEALADGDPALMPFATQICQAAQEFDDAAILAALGHSATV